MGRLTPQEIRELEFKQGALGFNKDQVNQFLDEVADELETLTQELNQIHQENKEARLALQTYSNVEESLKETLIQAKETSREVMQNARNEADTVLRKAQTEKDALLFSAKEDLAEVQAKVRSLRADENAMITKLKSILRSNLDVLETSFEEDKPTILEREGSDINPERIVDFSRADLAVEDLPPEEPEEPVKEQDDIFFSEPEDFNEA